MLINNFQQQVRNSDCFNESIYQQDLRRWKLLEELYINNYLKNNNIQNIPKLIHHIWLGSKVPDHFKYYINTWKRFNPNFKQILWTDKDIKKLKLINIDKYNKTNNLGQKSDILRYELLYKYGGIYVDVDFECLKSFNNLLNLNFFTSVAYPSKIEMYIGLIGSIPKHPIIKLCIDNMKEISDKNALQVMSTTGNYYFTNQFMEYIEKEKDKIIAFPTDYFYPFPNTNRDTISGDERRRFIKECSYAIHHWGVSWL